MIDTMLAIRVNGENVTLVEPATVADLLHHRRLERAACAVEVNRKVVPKRRHAEHQLHDGDSVEIVTLVGGG